MGDPKPDTVSDSEDWTCEGCKQRHANIEELQSIYEGHKRASEELCEDPDVNEHVNVTSRIGMAARALKKLRKENLRAVEVIKGMMLHLEEGGCPGCVLRAHALGKKFIEETGG